MTEPAYLTKVTREDGRGGTITCFCSTATGQEGYAEALRWLCQNEGISWHEAITKEGWRLDPQVAAEHVVWAKDRSPDGAPCPMPQERPRVSFTLFGKRISRDGASITITDVDQERA